MLEKTLDFFYGEKNTTISDAIATELDEHQQFLEKNGFAVKRSSHLINYEAAQCLTAEKGNVVLTTNRFLRGGKDLSIQLKQHGYETAVPLFPGKLAETVAVVNAAQRIR
ncbi:MAG: hypothetical protein H6Q72_361 [Firmicutes bacterium]|nr:hypothetical protein [Bacillota bacterium]